MAPGKGGTWKAKGGKSAGKNASFALTNGSAWGAEEGALQEITQQLQTPGSEGHVWVHDWGRRYEGTLGSLRTFLESRPDLFTIVPGQGKRFTVALAGGGARGKKGGGGKGGWGKDQGGWAAAKGGWGASKGGWGAPKGGKGWQGAMALPKGGESWDSTVGAAIREIKEQLQQPGSQGNVWIRQWGPRFQEQLGPLREFLESRPDKFTVVPGEGRKFTVELVQPGAAAAATGKRRRGGEWVEPAPPAKKAKGPVAGAPPKEESVDELTEAAIAEVTKQLEKPGNDGHVWVRSWPRRFAGTLGTLRDFLEIHNDKFIVLPGEGKKFTVELMVT